MRFDLAVIASDLAQCRGAMAAAAASDLRLLILSPPDGAARFGVGYFRALGDLMRAEFGDGHFTVAVDCGDAAGHALAALRIGIEAIRFTGDARVRRKLADMAGQSGAALIVPPADILDLTAVPDPFSACRAHLLRQRGGLPSAGSLA